MKRSVSVARLPSDGSVAGMSPVSASCSAMRCSACSTVNPSGMVSEYITDLPLFKSSMMSRIEARALISYSPAFSAESLPLARTPRRKIRASLIRPRRSSWSAISWTPVFGLTRKVSPAADGPGSLNACLPK
ncbi:hypothetical protein AJ88_29655 [Mesorhizobium amorphae CCBAU 01583]|nr:hypothetical protein AJ88_29655 [Mesorhizobium amorphae CCBAU 01583]